MAKATARLSKPRVRPKDTAAKTDPKPKKIIIFSDGTGNSAAALFKTNVRRFYEALDLARPDQIAVYDDGVGSSSFRPLAAVTGAVGFGLARNVRALYAFLCRNYRPGDQIYAFGFSRGAFTIRMLVGLIASQGIIPRGRFKGEAELQRLVRWAYRNNRRRYNTKWLPITQIGRFVSQNIIRFVTVARRADTVDLANGNLRAADGVRVAFMGLWDTVDAYGLPIDEFTKGWDEWVWPLSMRDQTVWEGVDKVCHALALDDERNTFHPRLIDEGKDERILQVWFTGMHADVGGGYAKDGLSYVTLKWMVEQAAKKPGKDGLVFKKIETDIIDGRADPLGHINDSRTGFGTYYRYQPRRIDRLAELQKLPGYKPKIHHSVFERIKGSAGAYAPIVLPSTYNIVDGSGNIHAPNTRQGAEDSAQALARGYAQERIWDEVWWRRVAYFTTLFVTTLLLLVPWLGNVLWLKSVPVLGLITDKDKCVTSMFCLFAGLPKLLGSFLPGFASTWVDAYSANPGVFAVLVLAIIALVLWSSILKTSINDLMSGVWANGNKPVQREKRTWIERLREYRYYKWFFWTLKNVWVPTVFGIFGAGFLYAYLPYVAANRIAFAVMDAKGTYCRAKGEGIEKNSIVVLGERDVSIFDTKEVCWATGVLLVSGATYEITLKLNGNWSTAGQKADPEGLRDPVGITNRLWWLRKADFLTKRFVMADYMVPIARIAKPDEQSALGQDEYVLRPMLPEADGESAETFKSRITAASSGQLFLYVNDSILRWPKEYYSNNIGTAQVFVKRVTLDEPMAPQAAARK